MFKFCCLNLLKMSYSRFGPPNTRCPPQDPSTVTTDTTSNDPELIRARVFVGSLKKESCTREDIIELFSLYGLLKGVTFFNTGGFAYVQYEHAQDANNAIQNLNNFKFFGSQLNVKAANPNLQKPLKQGGQNNQRGQYQAPQQPRQNQFNNGKQFQNKQQKFNAPQQPAPFNAFGTSRSYQPKGSQSNVATSSNAFPLGAGGYKNKKPMPQQSQQAAKRPRYNNYQQKDTKEYGSTNYNESNYAGYQNPYGQLDYGASGEENQQYSGTQQYEEGEYVEGGEYPAEYYDQTAYDQNYQYDPEQQQYYDEYGQPVEYVPQEGYEGQEYAYDTSNYQYVDGVYYDEYGQPVEFYPEGYEGQEYDPSAYGNDYYGQEGSGLAQHPPNLDPPSKSRKAEFVKLKEHPKMKKQPAAVQELIDRPIHYNYEIPDMFICGGCHFTTANPQYFMQHRGKTCKVKQVETGVDEPIILQCCMCPDVARNSWDLVRHLGTKHCLYLFNETHIVSSD